jgi:hypothetical protein
MWFTNKLIHTFERYLCPVSHIKSWVLGPMNPKTRKSETQNSGLDIWDERHFSKMFESTFHISINILPTPEPQNCGLPGLGSWGSGVLELRTRYVRLDKDIYQKCVNQCVCKWNFIDLPKFPKSWVLTPDPWPLRPSSPQFRGSGVGKMFINIWKVDSNIFEKCLSSQMSSPEFQVSDFRVSGFGGPGTQDSICETGHRYLSKVWKSICL